MAPLPPCMQKPPNLPKTPLSKPKVHSRFRWEIIAVPLVILGFGWLLGHIEPSFSFEELMDQLNVHHQGRYRALACLGIVVVAIVAVLRILRDSKKP